jgi:hypothetical protein
MILKHPSSEMAATDLTSGEKTKSGNRQEPVDASATKVKHYLSRTALILANG